MTYNTYMTINYWYEFAKIQSIKPIIKYKLLQYFNSPADFFKAEDELILHTGLLTRKQLHTIRMFSYEKNIDSYLYKEKINLITIYDEEYPRLLKEIYDPPLVLFCKGQISLLNKRKIAVVGSRIHSQYGKQICENLSKILSVNDITVVSGMAKGIDKIAHSNAIDHNTIAILGFGHHYCYPKECIQLKRELEQDSLVISEYPPDTTPCKYHFPARNRIISGLSEAVIIVEASIKSGSLITANFSIENGREVYVVPHQMTSHSKGCNQLIKEGANIITSIDELLKEIKILEIR